MIVKVYLTYLVELVSQPNISSNQPATCENALSGDKNEGKNLKLKLYQSSLPNAHMLVRNPIGSLLLNVVLLSHFQVKNTPSLSMIGSIGQAIDLNVSTTFQIFFYLCLCAFLPQPWLSQACCNACQAVDRRKYCVFGGAIDLGAINKKLVIGVTMNFVKHSKDSISKTEFKSIEMYSSYYAMLCHVM